ncbi:phosphate signaling complex protein PhoU [Phaeovulum sp. NW3]|uniref:phosphate signaling complex protein PhoU n=1 Tax=Phaeovulum sp. NW3 TaxID=2934933 RepID=UPI0020214A17|nr:phosphate signaling complex protein PhoU [Phaeovulum sp. NW3]MCL7465267.1 phosphate signaling complex protein PhoU [Phaeovulum sp. NW3]
MHEDHIMSAFDRDLAAVLAHVQRLGALAETAIHDSLRALDARDAALAEQVRQGDAALDGLEELINDEAARIIALRAPTAGDMRLVLGAIKIAASLERIGDYAKNIAKRAQALVDVDPVGTTTGTLRRMGAVVEAMLTETLAAYQARDAAAARRLRDRDQEVDQIYNSLFRTLLTHMMEDPRSISAAMHLHFVAKNIERMGDHVTTIAEQVIYLVEGRQPDEDRAKRDTTASTVLPNPG